MAMAWFPNESMRASPTAVSYLWEIDPDQPHNTLLAKVYRHGNEFVYSIKDETRVEEIRKRCLIQIEWRNAQLARLVAERFEQASSTDEKAQ